jgi:hypothetical protein
MFCKMEKKTGKSVTSASTNVIARGRARGEEQDHEARQVAGEALVVVLLGDHPEVLACRGDRTAPIMKAAKRMCDWTRTAITTFLPITGTSRLPMGILCSF